MATSSQRFYGNGLPVPEGIPGMNASQEEWLAYRRKQGTEATPDGPAFGVVVQDPALQALYSMLTDPSYSSPAGAGRGGPASTGIEYALADTGAGGGRGLVNPANVTPVSTSTNPAGNNAEASSLLMGAFPEAFLKSPPRGVVDTTFGVERVNARTAEHGTTATKDAQGRITLSNIGADGKPVMGTGSPNSVLGNGMGNSQSPLTGKMNAQMPNVSTSVQSAMNLLKAPGTTVSEALAQYESINYTVAAEQSRIQAEAIKFAETEFGLPQLNAQLQQSLIADKNSPSWYPGIGDSPVTLRIRTAIQSATNDVQIKANNYLKSNTSYTALEVAKNSATMALKQVELLNNRKEALNDRADQQTQLRDDAAQRKADAALEQRANIGASLSPEQQQRLILVNPNIGNISGQEQLAQMGDVIKRTANDTEMRQYMSAAAPELPTMAIAGNSYALTDLIAREKQNGRNDQEIATDVDAVKKLANDPKALTLAIKAKYSRVAGGDKLAAAEVEILGKAKLGGATKEEKDARYAEVVKLALDSKRQETASAPVSDLTRLKGAEFGLLQGTFAEAKRQGKSNSVKDVLTIFIGDSSGPERMAKIQLFQQEINRLGSSQPVSIFGMPNGAALAEAIVEAARPPKLNPVGVPGMGVIQGLMQLPGMLQGNFRE